MIKPLIAFFIFSLLAACQPETNIEIQRVQPAGSITTAIANPDRSAADLERDARSMPQETLSVLGLQPGDRVADLFSGGGYYTELLSYVVGPQGSVLSYNNPVYADGNEAMTNRLANNRLPNVTLYEAPVADMALGEGTLDKAIMILSYHDLYWTMTTPQFTWPAMDADLFLEKLKSALVPGGKVLVVDHSAAAGTGIRSSQSTNENDPLANLHRIEEAFVVSHFLNHGFELTDSSNALRNPDDPLDINMGSESIRGKTDRFVLVFQK